MHIIVQTEKLLVKRRIIRQYPRRIIVNLNTVLYGFNSYRFIFIGNNPMQLSDRQVGAERNIRDIDFLNKRLCFLYRRTSSKYPRNKFKLSYVVPAQIGRASCRERV